MNEKLKFIRDKIKKEEEIIKKIKILYFNLDSKEDILEFFEINDLLELDNIDFFFLKENRYDKNICRCLDRDGNIKNLYKSKKEALKHSFDRNIIAYPCPFEYGWHLSKKS